MSERLVSIYCVLLHLFFQQCQSADDQSRLYQSCMLAIQRITHSSPAAQVVVKICLVVNDIPGLFLIAELSILQWTKEEKTFITSITKLHVFLEKYNFYLYLYIYYVFLLVQFLSPRNEVNNFSFQEVFKFSVSFEKLCHYLKRLESPTEEFFQLLFNWVSNHPHLWFNFIVVLNLIFSFFHFCYHTLIPKTKE